MVFSKIIFFFFLIIIQFSPLFAQTPNDNLRIITVTQGDSLIKAGICYTYPKEIPKTQALFYWYFSGKIHRNCGSYSGKPLHDKYEAFDKNNNLIEQGRFNYGLKQGTWAKWYSNGIRKEISNYKNGIKEGENLLYNEKGFLISKETFRKGVVHGKAFYYSKDTTLFKEYKDGNEVIVKTKSQNKSSKKKKASIVRLDKETEENSIIQKDSIPTIPGAKKTILNFGRKTKIEKKQD